MVSISKVRCEGKTKLLITFPYAGGSSSFIYKYLSELENDYDVFSIEYPGRTNKLSVETSNISFQELCLQIVKEIITLDLQDYEIYFTGISMGGYIAFKVAQLLEMHMKTIVKKLVLFSVNSEQQLMESLSPPWPNLFLKEYKDEIDPSLYNYIKELMLYDGAIMKTMRLGSTCLMHSELTVANAQEDLYCHSPASIAYWANKSIGAFSYKTYSGGHIPSPLQFSEFIK